MAAATCVSAKNELVRHGGIAPSQWVLGKFPRGVGHMLEEEELGQLGVLEHQNRQCDGVRIECQMETGVRESLCPTGLFSPTCTCSFATVRPGKDGVQSRRFHHGTGKQKDQDGMDQDASLVFDHKVLWTLHQGTPVAVAAGRARPGERVRDFVSHGAG